MATISTMTIIKFNDLANYVRKRMNEDGRNFFLVFDGNKPRYVSSFSINPNGVLYWWENGHQCRETFVDDNDAEESYNYWAKLIYNR